VEPGVREGGGEEGCKDDGDGELHCGISSFVLGRWIFFVISCIYDSSVQCNTCIPDCEKG